jgi:amino acid transporter
MGGFQNFAISFTIISILAGCLTSFSVGFEHGGPSSIIWGWLLVGLMATIISLAMAEIASAYPTAGGLYYWASKLGSPGWGWATGWFNLIGQVAVTAAIGYGLATFGAVLLDFWFGYYAQMDDLFGASANASIYLLYAFFMLCACIINIFNIKITAGLNTISAYWHMAGVAFIVIVLIVVPDRHQSLSYVFTETVNNSGFGGGTTTWSSPTFWFVWGLGLLLAQYTITGFDASAHTAEETNKASRMAATGMWTSVVASVFFGWICLTASVTSASRMMFAFSRDGAVPGHQLWRKVARNRVPHWSVIGIGFFAAILMIPAVWNYLVGYFVGTAIAVIGLYIAFVIPVYLRLRKGDSWQEPRAWTLGKHYKWIDVVSLVWVAFITILFVFPLYEAGLPWSENFTWELTNYTLVWFAGIGLVFGGWWFLSAKHWFKGPVRMGTEEELEAYEEVLEGRTPPAPAPGS